VIVPSSAEVKNEWCCTSFPRYPFMASTGSTFPLPYIVKWSPNVVYEITTYHLDVACKVGAVILFNSFDQFNVVNRRLCRSQQFRCRLELCALL
jgi:hypothetical protein